MQHLSSDHIDLLAEIVIEEFGSDLNDDQLSEYIALTLEDVAGFECAPESQLQQTIHAVRSAYYVAASR